MNLKDRILNFHPDTDSGTIADALGVDEDEVIAAIHDVRKLVSPHDTIDAWLKGQKVNHCGVAKLSVSAKKFWTGGEISKYDASEGFFKIRNNDPARRSYLISDEKIVVRKLIDGDFYDSEYDYDTEIAELIKSLQKS